jgi:hypothetical protein
MPFVRNVFQRARDYVQRVLGPSPSPSPGPSPAPEPGPPLPPFPNQRPTSLDDVKARIQWAGRNRRVLTIDYVDMDGVVHGHRDVEPYSYRYRAKKDAHIPLFYAYCRMHQEIHAFKLQGIRDVQFTADVFMPRNSWEVEF